MNYKKLLQKIFIFFGTLGVPLMGLIMIVIICLLPFLVVGWIFGSLFADEDAINGNVLIDEWQYSNRISFDYDDLISCVGTSKDLKTCLTLVNTDGNFPSILESQSLAGSEKKKQHKGKISDEWFEDIHVPESYILMYKDENGNLITSSSLYFDCQSTDEYTCYLSASAEDVYPFYMPSTGKVLNRYGYNIDILENPEAQIFNNGITLTGDPIAFSNGKVIQNDGEIIAIESEIDPDLKFIYEGSFKDNNEKNYLFRKEYVAKNDGETFVFSITYKDEYLNPALFIKLKMYKDDGTYGYPFDEKRSISAYAGEYYNPFGSGATMHFGTDFPAPEGTPVYAIRGGTVIDVDVPYCATDGNSNTACHVTIESDDGMKVMYWHFYTPTHLKLGEQVSKGQVVGYVGSTGLSTGNHLHLELRDGNNELVKYCDLVDCDNPPIEEHEDE